MAGLSRAGNITNASTILNKSIFGIDSTEKLYHPWNHSMHKRLFIEENGYLDDLAFISVYMDLY